MKHSQKIIKYLAFAVALILIVMIISGIINGLYFALNAVGIIKEDNIISDNYEKKDIENKIKSLNIDLNNSNLYIKYGDELGIETNNKDIEINNNDGYINIKDTSINLFNKKDKDLIIYVNNELDILSIDTAFGNVEIEDLVINNLNLDLGTGVVKINNINVLNEFKLDGGIGNITLSNNIINNLEADLGIGEFNYSGTLIGNNTIENGVGISNILLNDDYNLYTINTKKGIGKIIINGNEINNNMTYGIGENIININGGIGNVKIDFNETI